MLHADTIINIDPSSVVGEVMAVAAIIPAHHADTCVEPVAHQPSVGRAAPRRITQAHAFSLGARSTKEFERPAADLRQDARLVAPAGKWQCEPLSAGIGQAERFL